MHERDGFSSKTLGNKSYFIVKNDWSYRGQLALTFGKRPEFSNEMQSQSMTVQFLQGELRMQ